MRKFAWGAGAVLLAVVFAVRIWAVNHSPYLEKYKAGRVEYEEGSEVELPNAAYYVDTADLTGYHMKITDTKLMKTADFLAQYGMTAEDLKTYFPEDDTVCEDYGLIYLVAAEFTNDRWAEPSDYSLILDNFLLVGTDYYVQPATGSIGQIPGFNPELEGASAFSIGSSRVFTVTIPYLLDTESESRISLDYFLASHPRLLLTVYPEERYLELPEPKRA